MGKASSARIGRRPTCEGSGTAGSGRWRRRAAAGLAALLPGVAVVVAGGIAGGIAGASAPSVQVDQPCTASALSADLAAAAATPAVPVTIELAAGCSYAVTALGPNGANGTDAFPVIVSGESVTIDGAGASISMASGLAQRFFEVDAGGSLALQEVTLTGGDDTSNAGGGAVLSGGTLDVGGSTLSDDTTSTEGGAIVSSGSLQVSGSTFSDDTAVYDGGAVANGVGNGPATATITTSTFTNDQVASKVEFGAGGAIDNGDGGAVGTLAVIDSTFQNDSVGAKGAPGTFTGGAIADGTNGTGVLTVTGSTFDGDRSGGVGGAIGGGGGDGGSGSVTVTVSTFQGNTAGDGAAVSDMLPGAIVASTFAGNVATASASSGTLLLSGAIQSSWPTLAADLIAGVPAGSPPGGVACHFGGVTAPASVDGGYDLAFDTSCGLAASSDGVVPGLAGDLGTLADNRGGATDTMALVTNGADPAVGVIPSGTADPAGIAGYPDLCGRTDQTGYTSPAGAGCAVGAYEPGVSVFAPPPPPPPPPGGGGSPLPPAFNVPVVNPPTVAVPLVTPTLEVVAPTVTVPYGSALPALLPSYTGFVGGDTAASLTSPASCTTTATVGSPVGTYPVTCSGASDPRYTIQYRPGSVQITPVPLVVQAPSATERYGSAPATRWPARYEGLVGSDTAASLTSPASCSTPVGRSSGVGGYPVTCGGAADANYVVSYRPGRVRVEPAMVTVVAPDVTVRYGTSPGLLVATYRGVVDGAGPSTLTRPATCQAPATAFRHVGVAAVRCHGAASRDYRFRYVPGRVVVTSAPLVVHGPVARGRAGTPLPPLPASYRGFVAGQSPASLASPARCSALATGHSPAGSYPVTCTGARDADYVIRYVPGRLTLSAPPAPAPAPAPIPHAVIAGSAGLAATGPGLPLPSSAVDAGRLPLGSALAVVPRTGLPGQGASTTVRAAAAPPVRVAMASIGLDVPVRAVGAPGGVLYPPTDIQTVGWWSGGPVPGSASGTSVLVGHVDGRNAAGVPVVGALFYLDRAPLGSTVVVRPATGRPLRYVLVARRLYPKAELPVGRIFTRSGPPRLDMITCGGPFDQVTRHYADNVVAYLVPAG